MIITDQLGQQVQLAKTPTRIISLVPSITELLYDLDVGDRLVGRTKFCVHPQHIRSQVADVGGTKNPRWDTIRSLEPDLIIANKEENTKSDVEELSKSFPVWVSDVKTTADTLGLIESLGSILGSPTKANQLRLALDQVIEKSCLLSGSVAYLIWKDPYMTVGHDTYIHHMLETIGLQNVFAAHTRYPSVTLEMIKEHQPDYVFLSSEPYPYKEPHRLEISNSLPQSSVILVDGEFFSWYGTRLLKKSGYAQELSDILGPSISLS